MSRKPKSKRIKGPAAVTCSSEDDPTQTALDVTKIGQSTAVTPKIRTQGVDTDILSQVISIQRSFYYTYFVDQTYPTCYKKYYTQLSIEKIKYQILFL